MSGWITVIGIILFLWRTFYYGHAGSCCRVHVGTPGRWLWMHIALLLNPFPVSQTQLCVILLLWYRIVDWCFWDTA